MAVATKGRLMDLSQRMCPRKEQTAMQDAGHNVQFDPGAHLSFVPPVKTWTMEELGFRTDVGVSPVAISGPFSLFSEDAVNHMRDEIMRKDVQDACTFSSNIAERQLRGYAKHHAPFTYTAWTHARTLEIISQMAGMELVPVFDYEIGHINFSTKTEEQVQEERRRASMEDEGIGGCSDDREVKPVVGWHTDSYPFVCVLMMSDCKDMKGGETAVRAANGRIIKVKPPTKGCAVIMQGRYITHQALRAFGAQERITSVTSFKPKSPFVRDDSELRTVRPVSDLNQLYPEFAISRGATAKARIGRWLEEQEAKYRAGEPFDVAANKAFLTELAAFVQQTNQEIVEPDQVPRGIIEDMHLADA